MEQKQTFAQKSRDFLREQGFYIVLFLCLLIVGTAIVLTALPQNGQENEANPTGNPAVESNVSSDETLQGKRTPLPTATPTPAGSATPVPTVIPAPTARPAGGKVSNLAAAPIDGALIWGYADDQLLYSKTLDQWTTHMGIDLAAPAGTEVKSVLAGTVQRVYMDDLLGQTVTVEHTTGRVSMYANLEESVLVEEGQKVNAGDVLGKVGATSVAECADAPHLHFSFYIDGAPVDPMKHVRIPHEAS